MSIQIKKIQSDETGPFTRDHNVVHIMTEAELGIIDAHNSELVLQMNAVTTQMLPWVFAEAQGTACDGVQLTPAALIRNYKLTSSTVGTVLKSNGLTNRVNENINYYKLSTAQAEAKSLFQANSNRNQGRWYRNGVPQSPFLIASRPLVSDVAFRTSSQLRTAEIRIPLRDIHPFYKGKSKLPALGMGRLTHEFLLENVVNVLSLPQMPGDEQCNDVNNATMGSDPNPDDPGSIVLTVPYILDQIPYYIDAPVRVTWTDTGGAQAVDTTIVGLYHKSATNAVGIQLNNPPTIAGGAATNVDIRILGVRMNPTGTNDVTEDYAHAPPVAPFNIDHFQLEIHRYILDNAGLSAITERLNDTLLTFIDYQVIDDTITPTRDYEYTIANIPPGTFAVAAFTPYSSGTRGLLGTRNYCDRYQFSIDGITTTTSDVIVGASDDTTLKTIAAGRGLYYDRLQHFMEALEAPLQRFDTLRWNNLQGADRQSGLCRVLYTQLIPKFNDGLPHQLTLNLYSDGAEMEQTTIHYVFFINRALRVQDGQVTGVIVI